MANQESKSTYFARIPVRNAASRSACATSPRLQDALRATTCAGGPFVRCMGFLEPVLFFRRTEERKRQRQKASPVGPPQREHPEALDVPVGAVIEYPGQQFDLPAPVAGEERIVEDKDIRSLFRRERIQESLDDPLRRRQEKTPPVDAGRRQKSVRDVLSPRKALLPYQFMEVLLREYQEKQLKEDLASRYSLSAPSSVAVEQFADSKRSKEPRSH